MASERASLDTIRDFLAQKRIAMVGISHEPTSFSAVLFQELCRRGYDVVPVNPNMQQVSGRKCFARVQDIQPPVEAALLLTSPAVTDTVVLDCAEAGIRRVWMHKGAGHGAVSQRAVEFCRERGIAVVPSQCPLMFLPEGSAFHQLHGIIHKLTGRYPRLSSKSPNTLRQ